jgi:hypothetical protein
MRRSFDYAIAIRHERQAVTTRQPTERDSYQRVGRSLGGGARGVAQGAFVTRSGSLVLRKDYKVLFVDTSGLTTPLGSGVRTQRQVAVGTGITVLGCWTGA